MTHTYHSHHSLSFPPPHCHSRHPIVIPAEAGIQKTLRQDRHEARLMLEYLMKLVVQRVTSASVSVEGKKVGSIKKGFLVLLGVTKGDTTKDADYLAEKLAKLRIMPDEKDKMNLSILDTTKEILVISQFTLAADTKKGNRPSFVKAADPDTARDLYRYFVGCLIKKGIMVQTGRFGEYMKIDSHLDGPVTIILNS